MRKQNLSAQSKGNDNEQKRDTHPNIKIEKHLPSLSEREIEAVKLFRDILDQKILDIRDDGKFTNQEMCDLLYPYLKNQTFLSRLYPNGDGDNHDSRHVNLNLAVAMRRVFGISIDELIDDSFLNFPPRQPPQK